MKTILSILIIVCLSSSINANKLDSIPSDTTNKASLNWQYLKSYCLDTRDFFTSPAKWDKNEWILASGVTATTIFLITQDQKLYDFFQDQRSPRTDTISKYFLEPWGSGVYSMPTMCLFYLHGASD